MQLNDRQQFKVMIAAFVLALIGEGVFAYFCWNRRAEATTALTSLDRQERDAIEKKKLIPTLEETARELQAIIEEYVKILPGEDEVGEDAFVEDIDRFTRNIELHMKSAVSLSEDSDAEVRNRRNRKQAESSRVNKFVEHKYRFEMTGTFLGLLQFLQKVENHDRFLQVDAIHVVPIDLEQKPKHEEEVLQAENPTKDIVVEISTYTYSKSDETPKAEGAKK